MTPDQFLARCKQIWHVAPAGAWASMATGGLRTAHQLIEAADLDENERQQLLTSPRSKETRLTVAGQPVLLRDQEPLLRADLHSLLEPGLTVSDWVRTLNQRVYLFTDPVAMRKMLDKYVERDGAQEVLTFSPRRLLDAARSEIALSAQNSGAVARRSDPYKGRDTFLSITRFPDRRPAEITVVNGLADLTGIVMRVERHEAGRASTAIT